MYVYKGRQKEICHYVKVKKRYRMYCWMLRTRSQNRNTQNSICGFKLYQNIKLRNISCYPFRFVLFLSCVYRTVSLLYLTQQQFYLYDKFSKGFFFRLLLLLLELYMSVFTYSRHTPFTQIFLIFTTSSSA